VGGHDELSPFRIIIALGVMAVTSVLFVCPGNICRRPAAEAVFQSVVDRQGAAERFRLDSRGTGGGNPDWYCAGGWSYHEGETADARMTKEARKRGFELTSRARPLTLQDLSDFDHIVCMEDKNREAVLKAADAWGGAETKELANRKASRLSMRFMLIGDYAELIPAPWIVCEQVSMMTMYCTKFKDARRVPDPWYEGGFNHVLDLLEDACEGLYERIAK
jgi:protein-tyrosine phosphatase